MTEETINQLNKLNQKFYQSIGSEFDQTRQTYWPGWEKLLDYIKPDCHCEEQSDVAIPKDSTYPPLKILDLGCGNGRFGEFLSKHFAIDYTGIDSSKFLLKQAKERLENPTCHCEERSDAAIPKDSTNSQKSQNPTQNQFNLIQADLLNPLPIILTKCHPELVSGSLAKPQKFDLITIFGVMHHIPGEKNRLNLLKQAKNLLAPDGLLVFTTWQFLDNERMKKKIIHCHSLNTQCHSREGGNPELLFGTKPLTNQLDPNDYILDWKKGEKAYRYCHYYPENEIKELCKQAGLKIADTYYEDGKERNVNKYYITKISL